MDAGWVWLLWSEYAGEASCAAGDLPLRSPARRADGSPGPHDVTAPVRTVTCDTVRLRASPAAGSRGTDRWPAGRQPVRRHRHAAHCHEQPHPAAPMSLELKPITAAATSRRRKGHIGRARAGGCPCLAGPARSGTPRPRPARIPVNDLVASLLRRGGGCRRRRGRGGRRIARARGRRHARGRRWARRRAGTRRRGHGCGRHARRRCVGRRGSRVPRVGTRHPARTRSRRRACWPARASGPAWSAVRTEPRAPVPSRRSS